MEIYQKLLMKNCSICNRIALIKRNKNKYFVKELPSGYIVLSDHQFYRGYTILLSKTHTDELHKLMPKERLQFLKDMSIVAEAVYKTFKPKKLNYELLGNTDVHLHWHIIPRYKNDPKPKTAVWAVDKTIRSAESSMPNDKELQKLKTMLLKNLKEDLL
jgi:diadenosine tetraphosphate (Ap4A) HIT family hydrolase